MIKFITLAIIGIATFNSIEAKRHKQRWSSESESDERPIQHFHESRHQSHSHKSAVLENENKRSSAQLQSSGGGFNTNVNQNNTFSPTFGNIGDIGASGYSAGPIQQRAISGKSLDMGQAAQAQEPQVKKEDDREFERAFDEIVITAAKFLKQILKSSKHAAHKHFKDYHTHNPKPEYFFDFRHIYPPNDRSSSSSSSESDPLVSAEIGEVPLFARAG